MNIYIYILNVKLIYKIAKVIFGKENIQYLKLV